MNVKIRKLFLGEEVPNNIKFTYDKTSKKRPAWIFVKNLPEGVRFLGTRINGKIFYYRFYLSTTTPLFLPTHYTKEEMKKFYNKLSQTYDPEIGSRNTLAVRFLFNKIQMPKDTQILDLGAGSGLSSVSLVKDGYKDITLLDFSKGMILKAKKKKGLKNCKFIIGDITKLKLKQKYDLIFSAFSFASHSYFEDKEMPKLWLKITEMLKPNGMFLLIGNDFEPSKTLFKKIKSGKYEMTKSGGYKAQWYIGRKIQ